MVANPNSMSPAPVMTPDFSLFPIQSTTVMIMTLPTATAYNNAKIHACNRVTVKGSNTRRCSVKVLLDVT